MWKQHLAALKLCLAAQHKADVNSTHNRRTVVQQPPAVAMQLIVAFLHNFSYIRKAHGIVAVTVLQSQGAG